MADELLDGLHDEGLITDQMFGSATADTSFGDAGDIWIDADTIRRPDGSTVRLRGYNALEVDKLRRDDNDNFVVKGGDVGGLEQTATISRLAREHGFTNLEDTGEVGAHGRPIYDLKNAAGTSLGDYLTEKGVVNPNRFSQPDAVANQAFDGLWRSTQQAAETPDEFHQAAEWIREAIDEISPGERLRQVAFDEQTAAAAAEAAKKHGYANPFYEDTVQVRNRDRKYDNKALNPLSVAWDSGLKGVVEGGAGLVELVGHETGWEELEAYGEGWKNDVQYDLQQAPSIILDYKEVEGTGDFIEYVGNLAAMSLPYMALTLGAAAVGGAALAAPAAVYAGQTWNEMGDTDETEKSASLAIGAGISMAVLDRLGIQGLVNTSLLNKSGRDTIIRELGKKGVTKEAAEAQLVQATRLEAAKLSGDAVKLAKEHITKRQVLKDLLANGLRGSTTESITEVGQEAIGYLAAVGGSDKEFDVDELTDRLTNAAIGGGVLGGGFAVPGTAYNTGAWADVAHRLAPADVSNRSLQNQWAEEEVRQHGRIQSHQEILAEAEKAENQRRNKAKASPSLAARAADETTYKKDRSWKDWRDELLENIPGLWRGSMRFTFNDELQQQSRSARALASIFGGQLDQVFSGATYENSKHLKLAEYKNIIDTPTTILKSFGIDKAPSKKHLNEVSKIIYGAYDIAGTDLTKLKGTEYEQHIPALKEFYKTTQRMTDKAYTDQKDRGAKINKLQDYALRHRSLDKVAVEERSTEFKKDLKEQYGMTDKEASDIVDSVINDADFTLAQGSGFKPGSHKGRTLNLSDNAVFKEKWLEQNIFNNISDIAKTAARYTTYQDFLGSGDGTARDSAKKVESLLQSMEEELIAGGMDPEQAKIQTDRAARRIRDYFDAESGNYKRPTSPIGRSLQEIQKNIMFYTTISSLPLATLSSTVELALTTKSLNKQQIGQLSKVAREEAAAIRGNWWHDKDERTSGRKQLRDLGFFEWEVGAATVTGVTETKAGRQDLIDKFFRAIGLKQFTDFTRATRASIAGDYMINHIETVAAADPASYTNEDVEARDALRHLGLNVEEIVDLYNNPQKTPEQDAAMEEMLRTATFNFVNDAIVLPQTANRPLFYNDPRFALFTQFHGFISAFQANHLPKLYRQAFKGQTPAMKYNAFAVMSTMIMLGFLSQHLKDLLKYGESTPYLKDTDEYLRRGLGATGLLGVSERAIELVDPIYEQRSSGPFDWAFNTVVGESAAASKLQGTMRDLGHGISGDPNKATKGLLKWVPGAGPLTGGRQEVADWLFEPEE